MIMKPQDEIYEFMKSFAVDAGKTLLQYRGRVIDIGKDSPDLIDDSHRSSGMAKTEVDHIIQEDFLKRLYQLNPHVRINVEEDTDSKKLFRGNDGSICTVHQDPCDGTKSYVDGLDDFSSGYAISDPANHFTYTVISAPVQKRIYAASPDELKILDWDGNCIDIPQKKSFEISYKIFEKRLLSEEGKQRLKGKGFAVQGMHCAHLRVIDVALGDGAAYLYGFTNPHDSMIPYAFAEKVGAGVADAKGNPIEGKNILFSEGDGYVKFERLPSVCYFAGNLDSSDRKTILYALSHECNLDPKYLELLKKRPIEMDLE